MKILLVEDDPLGGQAIKHLLSNYSYAVDLASDGETGLEMVDAFDYDLVLLDLGLPGLDGLSLCQRLRQDGHKTPILLLTGQGGASRQKAEALNAGADDYVSKPFDAEELIARIQALLRRGQGQGQPVLTWGKLSIDPSSRRGLYGSHQLALTPKQYGMLEMFLRQPKQVFSAKVILNKVWDSSEAPGEEAVRVHIKELRRKLQDARAPKDLIDTVYRSGYRLNPIYSTEVANLDEANVSMAQIADLKTINEELRLALSRLQETETDLRQKNQTLVASQQHLTQEHRQLQRQSQTMELQIAELTATLAAANRTLQQQNQQWQVLFNRSREAITIADPAGHYVDANPAACELFGVAKPGLLGSSLADFAEPTVEAHRLWQDFLQAGEIARELELRRPDGTLRRVELVAMANFISGRHLCILQHQP
jgi:PAS domain S-box-containing protein